MLLSSNKYDILNLTIERTDFLCQNDPLSCAEERTVFSIVRRIKGFLLEDTMLKGSKCTKETKRKMSLSRQNEKHWNWKGGRAIVHKGYVRIKDRKHPFANCLGYVYEHRKIIEKHIRRFLQPQESVHHINKNRSDNRIENLMLFANEGLHSKYEKRLKKRR